MERKSSEKRGLIAFDLDGTVIYKKSHDVPNERVQKAFEAAWEMGYQLAVATGRPRQNMAGELEAFPWIDWYICSNGAAIYKAGESEPFYSKMFSYDLLSEAVGLVRDISLRCWVDAPHNFLCETDGMDKETTRWLLDCAVVVDNVLDAEIARSGVYKLMTHYANNELRLEGQARLEKALAGRAVVVNEGEINTEVSPLGTSKGHATEIVCEKAGLPIKASIAFGDGGNDLTFGDVPLTFVAMETSEKKVLAAADDICPSVYVDGVAQWLEQHIL